MTSHLLNFCWEFCYELICADPKEDNRHVVILNLPRKFGLIVQGKLFKEGFTCTSLKQHGQESVIMRFKKIRSTVGN